MTVVAVAIAALAGASGCAEKKPRVRPIKVGTVDTGPESLAAARKQLEGTWDLVSVAVVQNGKATDLTGAGRLTYDGFGNMTILGRIEVPNAPSTGALLDYTGRAVIDPPKQQLRLVGVAPAGDPNASPPADLSFDKLRQYAFDGEFLKISTIDAAGKVVATATWRRAQ